MEDDLKNESELIREIVQVERDQDEITGYFRSWMERNPRPKVTMDQLAHMRDVEPRLEAWTDKYWWSEGEAKRCYIFTFDGTLNGARLIANTLGGDAILVMAATEARARELATHGIFDTVMHGRVHWYQNSIGEPVRDDFGLVGEVGGRKSHGQRPTRMGEIIGDILNDGSVKKP